MRDAELHTCCRDHGAEFGLRRIGAQLFTWLEEAQVSYWLEGSSLLGAMRFGLLNPWSARVVLAVDRAHAAAVRHVLARADKDAGSVPWTWTTCKSMSMRVGSGLALRSEGRKSAGAAGMASTAAMSASSSLSMLAFGANKDADSGCDTSGDGAGFVVRLRGSRIAAVGVFLVLVDVEDRTVTIPCPGGACMSSSSSMDASDSAAYVVTKSRTSSLLARLRERGRAEQDRSSATGDEFIVMPKETVLPLQPCTFLGTQMRCPRQRDEYVAAYFRLGYGSDVHVPWIWRAVVRPARDASGSGMLPLWLTRSGAFDVLEREV